MNTYTKIETPFKRDMNGTKRLIEGDFRNDAVDYLSNNQWYFTEKVDGCLKANTKLKLTDGTDITIREVVEKKLAVEIMGYDGRDIVPTKVINWYMNGQTDEWYYIKFDRRGFGTKGGNYYKTICCTGNHKFYVDGEYKRADEIKIGDALLYNRDYQSLTYQQEQILIGLLIGDGSVTDEGRSVEFSHKTEHEEYIDWLLSSLGSVAGNKQKKRISGYGTSITPARTISCTQIEHFTNLFIDCGRKIIPPDIELSPISVSIMYMDDGSLKTNNNQLDRCTLCLNDYDEQSVDNLVYAFSSQLHIYPVKYYSKGWNLRFNTIDSHKLQMLISPYVCNCMQYKLSDEYKNIFIGELPNGFIESVNEPYRAKVIGVEVRKEIHKKFDITTETHNYFANGILVHNCNIGVNWDGHKVNYQGRTERAQIPAHLTNKLIEIFGTNEAEEMFEQMFGEKEVVLFGEGYGAKIQKGGGNYIPDGCDFILFDVYIPSSDTWLKWDDMAIIADAFNIKHVPHIMTGTIQEAIDYVKTKPVSHINPNHEMEGLVGKPLVDLYDRNHKRVMVKIKVKDFT